jgi:hypothetical protein
MSKFSLKIILTWKWRPIPLWNHPSRGLVGQNQDICWLNPRNPWRQEFHRTHQDFFEVQRKPKQSLELWYPFSETPEFLAQNNRPPCQTRSDQVTRIDQIISRLSLLTSNWELVIALLRWAMEVVNLLDCVWFREEFFATKGGFFSSSLHLFIPS